MLFNGHTPDSIDKIDEETLTDICVMYGDGVLGGRAIYDAITPLTSGVFNYMCDANSSPFNSEKLFPWVNEYQKNPDNDLDAKELANNSLLLFMSQAPGFNMERIK